MTKRKSHFKRGSAILLSVLLVAILLSISLALTAVFLPKYRNAVDVKNSSAAAYAAETGLEWCLFIRRVSLVSEPVLDNGASFVVDADSCASASTVRSSGSYRGVTRTFEISF